MSGKKLGILFIAFIMAGCSTECPENVCPECPEAKTIYETVEVEKIVEVEVNKAIDPSTVLQEISASGMYMVPEEVQSGQWSFKAPSEDDSCYIATYDELDNSDDNKIKWVVGDNKGFFKIEANVRMVEFRGGGCVYTRIGE